MSKKKSAKPDIYRSFMTEGFFPNANKITKFEESENYWIFKTGKKVIKVKKKIGRTSTIPLEEIFCREIVALLQAHSPALEAQAISVIKSGDAFLIDWDHSHSETPSYFAICMNQLPDRGFLSNLISQNKLTEPILKQVSQHLVDFHQSTKVSDSKDAGTPELISTKLDDLFYQSKKYLNVTITQAIIDMTFRPMQKYLTDNRKLLLKRIKKENIRLVHGCLIPRKIHAAKEGINLLGKTNDPLKNRFNDVASDLADLTVELNLAGLPESSKYLADTYAKISGDREIKQVLPLYQALRCLDLGLKHSILSNQSDDTCSETEKSLARRYYEQTIEVVRGL